MRNDQISRDRKKHNTLIFTIRDSQDDVGGAPTVASDAEVTIKI